MRIIVAGVNHRTAPVEFRERLAFRAEDLPAAYAALREQLGTEEALILSTCNRVEIYAGVPAVDGTFGRLSSFLSARARLEIGELASHWYAFDEPQSIEHLFTVASGLDSMVLGETEILHQVKRAYEFAQQHGSTGKTLNVLFQKALNAAKAVQDRTAIGRGAVSVGTVALELAEKIFGDLRGYRVMLVGAGKIGELVVQRLADRGVADVVIVNRSLDRAQQLAIAYGGRAASLEALDESLLAADIVLMSTASPHALVTRERAGALMSRRRQRPLCIIDLGVPRNVEANVGQLENVYLFNIDDLEGLVNHHHARRREAVTASQAILAEKVEHFLRWRRTTDEPCDPLSSVRAPAP